MLEKLSTARKTCLALRFWRQVSKGDDDICWEWLGGTTRTGYGQISARTRGWRRMLRAHRLAYVLTYGEFDDALHVMHNCDTKLCCNPKHLKLGTDLENKREADARHLVGHNQLGQFYNPRRG